ncbi:N-acetyltransferase [Pseudomonas luteola]
MTTLVDPHVGFVSFQQAIREGAIAPSKCDSHPDLYVFRDEPQRGVQRLTYAFIKDKQAKAYAVFVEAESMKGKPCFGLGYATDATLRGQGIATELVEISISELSKGLTPYLKSPGFYVEAIVGMDNPASQKVAAKAISDAPTITTESTTRKEALQYVKYVI